MKKVGLLIPKFTGRNVIAMALAILALTLLLFRLSTIVAGMSMQELDNIKLGLGWHGLYNNPLFLPIQLIRSAVVFVFGSGEIFINRLPNVLFGFISIVSFAAIVKIWHDSRTAILTTLLFMSSAWVLHASRTVSFEVIYLCLLPVLILSNIILHKYVEKPLVVIATITLWGLFLTIPGGIWFILVNSILQKKDIIEGWKNLSSWWHYLMIFLGICIWLPIMVLIFVGDAGVLAWLGLPDAWSSPFQVIKDFAAVPIHLFIRGPEDPFIWLGRAPILDVFSLAVCAIGIYYYVDHWHVARSNMLIAMFVLGFVLVGLGGYISISVLVPLLYIAAAMGIAYLSKQWTKVFPFNPLAKVVGIGLMILVVSLSCIYNLRSYFIAWPNNKVTTVTFRYHP